jgi:hypothetical protein
LDILVAAGLNARLDVRSISALQLAVRRAGPPLAEAGHNGKKFTDLTSAELADQPVAGTTGSLLTTAWRQMTRTPGIGVAIAHKVLHHKQPALFPLLDGKTARVYRRQGGANAWQQIWTEITDARGDFEELRTWFAAEARDGVALTLTRLHDILLWLQVIGQWTEACAAGEAELASGPG